MRSPNYAERMSGSGEYESAVERREMLDVTWIPVRIERKEARVADEYDEEKNREMSSTGSAMYRLLSWFRRWKIFGCSTSDRDLTMALNVLP